MPSEPCEVHAVAYCGHIEFVLTARCLGTHLAVFLSARRVLVYGVCRATLDATYCSVVVQDEIRPLTLGMSREVLVPHVQLQKKLYMWHK